MPLLLSFRIYILISFIFLATLSGAAQDTRPNFTRQNDFDVQHYILRVSFDHPKRTVFGDTTVQLKPVGDGLKVVELDQNGISFESVHLEPSMARLEYQTKANRILITLDREYSEGEMISLRFKYSARPKKGVYFVNASRPDAKTKHSAQIWTQGQPDEAHHWFPSFDFPSDKATSEKILTVQKGQTVIGNGLLIERKENEDETVTYHYKMSIPHPTYLISFVVGEYTRTEEKIRDIPLGYYMYPGTEDTIKLAYGRTRDFLRIHEELTGIPYPFNKYDQTIVAGFQFGGMENITATTMADSEIFFARSAFMRGAVEDLVVHEIAHSWFGNLVTCKNWAELWLNEGFATFMEAKVREELYGRADYARKIRLDAEAYIADEAVNRRRNGLFNLNADNIAGLFDRPATTYNKGGAVVHQLREQVGDKAFWKAVNIYLARHRYGSVETEDLRRVMEETSGQKLDWFFDQWVYGLGYPKLRMTARFDAESRTLELTLAQTQKEEFPGPKFYRLPLEIELSFGEEKKIEEIEMTERTQAFSLRASSMPTGIILDPKMKIPLKTVATSR